MKIEPRSVLSLVWGPSTPALHTWRNTSYNNFSKSTKHEQQIGMKQVLQISSQLQLYKSYIPIPFSKAIKVLALNRGLKKQTDLYYL